MELLIALAAAVTLTVPGRASATPSIAANGDFVVAVWSAAAPERPADIYAAVSRDGGRAFGAPVRVNDVEGDARVGGEQPPRVALAAQSGRDPRILVVWTTKDPKGSRLRQSSSEDGGRTFARATAVPGTEAPGNRGWETIAGPYALWLDHRELAHAGDTIETSHHDHAGHANLAAKADGVAMAQRSKLYFGSLDESVPPHAVTGGVCYCCKTAMAIGPEGSIHAAWRHVYPGNIRDIAYAVSHDGGRTFTPPVRVSEDKWVLDGCPENGPAMAVDASQRVHVVWPTLVESGAPGGEQSLALFYASSRDGRTFTARESLPVNGAARHPQIAIAADGSLVIVWDEGINGQRRVVVAAAATGGVVGRQTLRFTRDLIGGAEPAVYPTVAAVSDAVLVAWTSGQSDRSTIRVERQQIR